MADFFRGIVAGLRSRAGLDIVLAALASLVYMGNLPIFQTGIRKFSVTNLIPVDLLSLLSIN